MDFSCGSHHRFWHSYKQVWRGSVSDQCSAPEELCETHAFVGSLRWQSCNRSERILIAILFFFSSWSDWLVLWIAHLFKQLVDKSIISKMMKKSLKFTSRKSNKLVKKRRRRKKNLWQWSCWHAVRRACSSGNAGSWLLSFVAWLSFGCE